MNVCNNVGTLAVVSESTSAPCVSVFHELERPPPETLNAVSSAIYHQLLINPCTPRCVRMYSSLFTEEIVFVNEAF